MEKTDALALINRELEKRNLTSAEVGRKLNLNQSSAYYILKRKNISVQHVAEFSEILQYNFFRELAAKFPYAEPANEEVSTLQERVKELELEVSFLRRTIKDMMGK